MFRGEMYSLFIFNIETQEFIFEDLSYLQKKLKSNNLSINSLVDNYLDSKSKRIFWQKEQKYKSRTYQVDVLLQNQRSIKLTIAEYYLEEIRLVVGLIYCKKFFVVKFFYRKLIHDILHKVKFFPCVYDKYNNSVRIFSPNLYFGERKLLRFDEFSAYFDEDNKMFIEKIVINNDRRYYNTILRSIDSNKNLHYFKLEFIKNITSHKVLFVLSDITDFSIKDNILTDKIKKLINENSELRRRVDELTALQEQFYSNLLKIYQVVTNNCQLLVDKFPDNPDLKNYLEMGKTQIGEIINRVQVSSQVYSEDFSTITQIAPKDRRIIFDKKDKQTILIAEDEPINYAYLELLVKKIVQSPEIIYAKNGKDAVELAQQNPIDLIIMDIRMPILDGIAATNRIRQFNKDVPIILISAFSPDRNIDDAEINDFISKPLDKAKIEKVLKKYLR